MTHLSCQPDWVETYLATMEYQENSLYALQQIHFAIAENLSETLERHLQQMTSLKDTEY